MEIYPDSKNPNKSKWLKMKEKEREKYIGLMQIDVFLLFHQH